MDSSLAHKELNYIVLSNGLPPGDPSTRLYNQAYAYWTSFWNDVYRSVGVADRAQADQFRRHNALSLLVHGEEIVAMHCYTFFNLNLVADREHSFFAHSFTPKAMRKLDQLQMKSVMTMEYFSVAKAWQKKSKSVALGVVLLSLSQKLFLELGMDMWIGVPRADIGVAKLCYAMGAIPLDQGLTIHGALSDLIGVTPDRARWVGTPTDQELVAHLWGKRDLRLEWPRVAAPLKQAA